MYKGIDVSGIQGIVDWNAVANAGYSFAILKSGNGNDPLDSSYGRNLSAAKSAGLKVAVYNVVYPLTDDGIHPNRAPSQQAALHYNASQGIVSAIDLEWPTPDQWNTYGIDASFIQSWTLEYLSDYTKLSGQAPYIYSYPYFFNAVNFGPELVSAVSGLWIASYTQVPTIPYPFTDYSIWQESGGTVKLPGTNVAVDEDFIKDPAVLASLS